MLIKSERMKSTMSLFMRVNPFFYTTLSLFLSLSQKERKRIDLNFNERNSPSKRMLFVCLLDFKMAFSSQLHCVDHKFYLLDSNDGDT
jgi:hypothetical protein